MGKTSPYLTRCLFTRFNCRSKAVADGAISFYLDGHVSSRVAPITIGAPSGVPYNAFDPDHLRRTSHHRKLPSGKVVITGGFEVVLEKVVYFKGLSSDKGVR